MCLKYRVVQSSSPILTETVNVSEIQGGTEL
jgi:hypothetical protein